MSPSRKAARPSLMEERRTALLTSSPERCWTGQGLDGTGRPSHLIFYALSNGSGEAVSNADRESSQHADGEPHQGEDA